MPNLDQHSTKLLNLTVLQRIDPFVEEILITAAHVTFYEFNIDLSQWVRSLSLTFSPSFLLFHSILIALIALQSRKDVEGSLFVVKRFVYFSPFYISRFIASTIHVFWFEVYLVFMAFSFLNFRNTQPRFQFIVMNRRNTG